MSNFQDLEIQRTPDPLHGDTPRRTGLYVAGGLLVAAAAVAAYIVFVRTPGPDDVAVAETEVVTGARPAGAAEEAIDVPPLDETDPFVRRLAGALSSHPHLAAWLATDDLVRSFVDVVDAIAAGRAPSRPLAVLAPAAPFAVIGRGAATTIDPRSYARYDALADAFASLDVQGTARLYTLLRPRLEEAYKQRFVGPSFDGRLERAIAVLLDTPEQAGDAAVTPRGVGYDFADPEVEARPDAQKQLLRMGPRNVGVIQRHLREIAGALDARAR